MTEEEVRPIALEVVHQRSLSEEVADRIREGIVTGTFKPGQHLREVDMAEALEVSRSPVRDAFAQLHHEGLVTVRRHRGAVVVGLSSDDIEDLYSLRRSLEGLAVGLATERATPAELEQMRELASGTGLQPTALKPRQFAEADIAFHDLLYQAAHHARLYACWSMLRPHIFRFLLTRNIAEADYEAIFIGEHAALAEVIADRSAAKATEMIASHLEGSHSRLVKHYPPGRGEEQDEGGGPPGGGS
jgi:DNA-binding GntR family transcriptional regulator